jgi:hypothetical protein
MKKLTLVLVVALSVTSCSMFDPDPPPLLDSKRKSCVEKTGYGQRMPITLVSLA